jgi:hypothetical protein
MSSNPSQSLTERLAIEFAEGAADLERPAQLPGVPVPTEDLASIVRSVRALKTIVDTLTGTGGSVLDKAVTTREILQEGVALYSGPTGITGGGGTLGDSVYEDPRPVLPVPPAPTNLTALGAFANIILDWDLLDYRNHAFTEVLRHTADNVAAATVIGTAVANQYVDATAAVGTTYYYWVRAVNLEAVTGPVNATAGTSATLAVPPGVLLDALTGQITESQLYSTLGARINLIDASASVTGSVNKRIADAQAVVETQIQGVQDQVNDLTTAQATTDSALAQQITTLSARVGTATYRQSHYPVPDRGQNMVLWSEQFDRTAYYSNPGLLAWGSGSTANATTAPDGTATADLLTENTSNTSHGISLANTNLVSFVAGRRYTLSAYAKLGPGTRGLFIGFGNVAFASPTWPSARFNLVAGTVVFHNGSGGASGYVSNPAATIEPVGNGWYRCAVTATAVTTASDNIFVQLHNGTTNIYTGDGASGIYVWGLQLEESPAPGQYVKTEGFSVDLRRTLQVGDIWVDAGTSTNLLQNVLLSSSAWDKYNVTVTAATDPLGGSTAWKLNETTFTNSYAQVDQRPVITTTAGSFVTWQVYAKAGERDRFILKVYSDPTTAIYATAGFNVATGRVYATHAAGNAVRRDVGMRDVGGGWYLCWITCSLSTSDNKVYVRIAFQDPTSEEEYNIFNGVAGYGFTVWRPMLTNSLGPVLDFETGGSAPVSTVGNNSIRRWNGTQWELIDNARFGELSAALQTEATTRANADGAIEAKYTVKVDVNGYVSGYGLIASANNSTPVSDFAVRADRFYIASPSGPDVQPAMPFIVQTTSGAWGPAGVYITNAAIQNAAITTAKIADLAVDNAKIADLAVDNAKIADLTVTGAKIANATITDGKIVSLTAGKITAGSLGVGQYIQSTSYTPGSTGWSIDADGTAEFGSATIRGQVSGGALTIDTGGSIRSGKTGYGSGTGWYLDYNGGTPRLDVGGANSHMRWDGTDLTLTGLLVRNSSGTTLLSAKGDSVAPWVTYVTGAEGGTVPVVYGSNLATNTVKLKNLEAGDRITLTEPTPGVIRIQAETGKIVVGFNTSEFATTSGGAVNIPNVAFDLEANQCYLFEAMVRVIHTNDSAGGGTFSMSLPSGAVAYSVNYGNHGSAGSVVASPGVTSTPQTTVNPSSGAQSSGAVARLSWIIVMGSTAGRVNVRVAKFQSGGSVVIKRGSWFSMELLNREIPNTGVLATPPAGIPATPTTAERFGTARYKITIITSGVNAGKLRLTRTRMTQSDVNTDYTILSSGVIGAFDVMFEVTGTSSSLQPGSTVSSSNGAPNYVPCNIDRVFEYSLTMPTAYTTSTAQVTVAVRFRNQDTGSITTMQTLTLNLASTNFEETAPPPDGF